MKLYWYVLASLLLTGCLKVPEGPTGSDAGDMAIAPDLGANDSGTTADGGVDAGSTTRITLPLPVLEIGVGATYGNTNTIRYIRRRLMFRYNANVFVGTSAQVVGRQRDFDAIFIDSADDAELAALETAEIPVFMTSYVAAERLGLTDPREATLPLLSFTVTPEHPNPAPYDGLALLRSEDEVYQHPTYATGATVFATGETGTETLPVMVGVDTGAMLLGDQMAPQRRGYYAGQQYTNLSVFGETALTDAISWTFQADPPPADKKCGLITDFDDRVSAFAERLKLHGCEIELLEPDNVDTAGLDLVVIAPGLDEVLLAQLLAPAEIPVVAFYEGNRIALGFELIVEDVPGEDIEITSIEVLPRGDELLGTSAAGTLDISLDPDIFRSIPADNLIPETEVFATFATGQPAVFGVDRGVMLETLQTEARFILLPSTFLSADETEGAYSPYLRALDFVDHAIQWTLAEEEE